MNANDMMTAQNLINSINENVEVKVIKKDRGLLERKETEEQVILTEDNRRVLLG